MTRKDQNETNPSKFRALMFRNPFASSSKAEKSTTAPIQDHRGSEPISHVSIADTTNSGLVSTVASTLPSTIPSSRTSAATSPESEDGPDGEQNDHTRTLSNQGLRISIPPGITDLDLAVRNDRSSIASSNISPLGGPRINTRWSSLEDPGTSVDGGADNLQSNTSTRSVKMSPIRLSGSPIIMSRPASLTGSIHSGLSEQSARSFKSYGSSIGDGGEWEFEALLEMTDEIRAALKSKGTIPKKNLEELNVLLDAMLHIEVSAKPSTDIDLLVHTRFDQLLKDIGDSKETMCRNLDRSQVTTYIKAGSLRRKWERRFMGNYFNINKPRTEHMKINGPLRGLTLIGSDGDHGLNWLVSYKQPAELEGHIKFAPGDWWLNMHCALRDGVVGSVDKMLTMGKSGVVALALFTGEEIPGPTLNLFEYSKISHNMDELVKLMTCNRGRPIRVLRSSNLKSKYAPAGGVRYDGLHVVKQFGHKLLDETKNVYRCMVTLERSSSQKPFAEVLELPKPSQMDDWELYKRFVGEEYRKREGQTAYEKWVDLEDEQQAEKEQFLKARALEEGIRRHNLVERKTSSLQSE